MLKKLITTAVLGVSALSVISANAADPGVYMTGQLGYANAHIAKDHANDTVEKALDNKGLAGRIALGYQFNQNFAAELGYLRLKNTSTISDPRKSYVERDWLQQAAVDIAVKGIVPISDSLNVYGKLGAAYVITTFDWQHSTYSPTQTNRNGQMGIAGHKWAPEAAVGVSYDITSNVSIDTSWTHIQPVGKNRPNNIDFVAVGLGYNFG